MLIFKKPVFKYALALLILIGGVLALFFLMPRADKGGPVTYKKTGNVLARGGGGGGSGSYTNAEKIVSNEVGKTETPPAQIETDSFGFVGDQYNEPNPLVINPLSEQNTNLAPLEVYTVPLNVKGVLTKMGDDLKSFSER